MTTETIGRSSSKRTSSKTKRRKPLKPETGTPRERITPMESVQRALELMKPQLATALPEHLTADRLLQVVMTVLRSNPALLDCDRASLYRAVMTCAQLGLEPDGVLGQAWLVPSRGKVQLVPGYRGFLALARNSGQVTSINAQAVHRNDHFDYAYGLNERLEHVPAAGDRGEISHFYAYARFKDGGHHFDVMSKSEVDAARERSESYQAYRAGRAEDSAWVNGYAEMGKKTVIRRIAKYLPLAVQKAAALADLHEAGKHAALDDFGEIVVDLDPLEEEERKPEATVAPRSRLDAFAAGDMERLERVEEPEPQAPVAAVEVKPVSLTPAYWPEIEPEGVELSEEELFALLPPLHLIEILDAVAEREMPEEVLESIVGKPLDEVSEEEVPDLLRAIAIWDPDVSF
jgi:recombination protein RecT